MLHHTFVATMLETGVDPRDVQIAGRHAHHDPTTTVHAATAAYSPNRKDASQA